MLSTINYEGNVVELRKDVVGENEDVIFSYKEKDIIDTIQVNTNSVHSGITIYFLSGKVIDNPVVTNYNSWLRRHFKLFL
jgi:hypothetical protein